MEYHSSDFWEEVFVNLRWLVSGDFSHEKFARQTRKFFYHIFHLSLELNED